LYLVLDPHLTIIAANAYLHAFPFPILVLLDLKLPGNRGLEVLEWMNQKSL
jgi:CheY-like chemotaxis protein